MKIIDKLKLQTLKLLRPLFWMKKYYFDSKKYPNTIISKYPKITKQIYSKANEVIYGFWTGENEITPNRKRCIETIKKHAGVPFILVTPENLNDFIIEKHPLHPAYEFLSLNHRSDYLRCYFMHFHGGGYIDIKEIESSWDPAFKQLNGKLNKWLIGYPELAPSTIPMRSDNLGSVLRKNFFRLIGNGGFICKPNTPFTEEWLKLVEDYLSENYDKLKENPGNTFGTNDGYPLPWASVQGAIFHPLCLKYHEYILQNPSLQMSFENYK